jgi:hypothetical protein
MMEILTAQVIAAIFGMSSNTTAEWLYHRSKIGRSSHSLWVSVSNTAICLPIITWIAIMFLGNGLVSWTLVTAILSLMFFWQYHNLLKIPPTRRARHGPMSISPSGRSIPPPSNIGR